MPFRQIVLKVHSRCDLACDHCYVYEHADQSWRTRPKVIGSGTVSKAGERIAEHARQHALAGVRVILHGGEPLLAGAPRLAEIARALRAAIEPVCELDLRIHTNGVRLDEELCELFLAERVKVGISVDGDRAANDLHRRFRNGNSSYDHVVRAVSLLRGERYREIYAGLLCTIDVRSDPVACYRALAALEPPAVDFLLPHATWDAPPPGAAPDRTPYADWLAAVFAEWLADDHGRIPVRMFRSIIATTRGGASSTESLGLEASDVVVIETDGSIEQADSIKVAFDGAPATGFDIAAHSLDAAAAHPGVRARQQGQAGLSATCRQCPVVTSCGGGLYAHRYRSGSGFDNPSVYCADLEKIITHVRAELRPLGSSPARQQPAFRLRGTHFAALASGFGDDADVAHLVSGQRYLLSVLLEMLHDRATKADAHFLAGWELLDRVRQENAPAVQEVLGHPYVRAWAEQCLSDAGPLEDGGLLGPDARHLASIAAAAAARAGLREKVDVPVITDYVHLPTLGRLHVGAVDAATVCTGTSGFEVRTASGAWRVELDDPALATDWEPVRTLRAGQVAVRLEDTDPYRDCYRPWTAAARLPDAEAARWQEQFTVAWELIERCYPAYAPGLAAGLGTLMPLADDMPGREISASTRPAFGAVAAALPVDGAALALLLIHEFQHVKLGAVLDFGSLYNAVPGQLFYAPWRDDPRPVEALLQGTYAHLGVTDYWRARRRQLAGPQAVEAAGQFARWRALTAEAIERLAGSGALTALGERFVAGLRRTVTPWLDEPVPAAAADAAGRWIAEREQAWRRLQDAVPR